MEKQFDKLYADKKKLIENLEELFRKKIPVEEAATYWSNASLLKSRQWTVWLTVFVLLTLLPLGLIIFFWNTVADAVVRITSTNGNIALGGVAAITVPALLYGWLLKNVSRMFVQSLMLAEDAAHRRLLTMTYLGLAKEPQLHITDNERAIILNALFRPMPPYTSDDGPPSGLIELIGRKSS